MRRLHFLTAGLLILMTNQAVADCVILLHGLARSDQSMTVLEASLEDSGYTVVNQDYASTESDIAALAAENVPKALNRCPENTGVNFVTHSLGGILVRQYLADNSIEHMGRVVMLGPPNQGSEIIDTFAKLKMFRRIMGPAGTELGTDTASVPNTLGGIEVETGIIAGSKTWNPFLSGLYLPGEDDGKVTVESTKLEGMADHIVLPVSHVFIMRDDVAIAQTLHFLENGKFKP